MAKSKSFFGLRAGSTRAHTYASYRGEQVTKERVRDIKDPKTMAQTLARMRLSICSQTAAACRPILQLGFPQSKNYAQAKREFMRLNNDSHRERPALYNMYGQYSTGMYRYMFSKPQILDPNWIYANAGFDYPSAGYRFENIPNVEDLGFDGICEMIENISFFKDKVLVAVTGYFSKKLGSEPINSSSEVLVDMVTLKLDESVWDVLKPSNYREYQYEAEYNGLYLVCERLKVDNELSTGVLQIRPNPYWDISWLSCYLLDTKKNLTTCTIPNTYAADHGEKNIDRYKNEQISSYINH